MKKLKCGVCPFDKAKIVFSTGTLFTVSDYMAKLIDDAPSLKARKPLLLP